MAKKLTYTAVSRTLSNDCKYIINNINLTIILIGYLREKMAPNNLKRKGFILENL